jgi:DNA polymerase-3 subunit beta
MKFTTTAKHFRQALQIVEEIIPQRTTMQAATYVALTVKGKLLSIRGTDARNYLTFTTAITGEEDGTAIVPAKKLLDFVKSLSDENVDAKHDPAARKLCLTVADKKHIDLELPTLLEQDFPTPVPVKGETFTVKQLALQQALRLTGFAAAQEAADNKYVLNGCNLSFSSGACQVTATDGRRLARHRVHPVQPPTQPSKSGFIFPSVIVSLLLKHLTHDVVVQVTVSDNQVALEYETPEKETYLLQFAQIAEQYPDCDKFVIPPKNRYTINRLAFMQALKRATNVLTELNGKIFLNFEPNQLIIQVRTSDSSLQERIPMEFNGAPILSSFTPKYIAEALEELTDEVVTFDLESNQHPLVIESADYLYVSMPLRV